MSTPFPTTERRCQNCGSPMYGDHCYACGQPVKGLVRHFGSILGDFFDSVFDLDSRLLKTIGPLLFRPGYLSRQYFAGHRVRYVSPVRLFVFLCIAAFFVLQLVTDIDVGTPSKSDFETATTVAEAERLRDQAVAEMQRGLDQMGDNPGRVGMQAGLEAIRAEADQRIEWLRARDAALARGEAPPAEPDDASLTFNGEPWDAETNPIAIAFLPDLANNWLNQLAARGKGNITRVKDDPRLLVDAFLQSLPQTLFVLLPLFALFLKVAYLFKRRLYMEHLIVALHSHAFLCVAVLVLVGVEQARGLLAADGWAHSALGVVEIATAIWMPLYLWLMQKRVYGQGVIMTTLKFGVLGLVYTVLLSLGATANLLVSLVAL